VSMRYEVEVQGYNTGGEIRAMQRGTGTNGG
jgi:hypothetical protein